MSRLIIEVTEQQHQQIKALAALQGKSIKDFALERLFVLTLDEEKALGELKALLRPRIEEALREEIADQGITDISEAVLGEGEGSRSGGAG
jgi:uncharacterized protein (DUF1778 family)